jgi:hypothetical protein
LIENCNPAPKVALTEPEMGFVDTSAPIPTIQLAAGQKKVLISTPRKKIELKGQLRNLASQDKKGLATQRLVFSKVEKAFDQTNFALAQSQRENEALRAQLEAIRPSKRKKVVPDPNSKFVNIEQIHRAQIQAGRINATVSEENGSKSGESEASCIVVQSNRR